MTSDESAGKLAVVTQIDVTSVSPSFIC